MSFSDLIPDASTDPNEATGLADEALSGQLSALLQAGVRAISSNQTITFTRYKQYILPIDGYLFWVRENEVTLSIQGSLHVTADQHQDVDETKAVQTVVFTALKPVVDFAEVDPKVMWIGEYEKVKFGFNSRTMHYSQSGLNHYVGTAIYPSMETQFLHSTADLPTSQILTNSIPFWLSLTGPIEITPGNPERIFVYPEYLVSANKNPPYIAVEVLDTQALQPYPVRSYYQERQGTDYITKSVLSQLMKDKVRLHVYGMNNQYVMTYLDYLMTFFEQYGSLSLGLVDGPVIKDVPVLQSEYNVRAQKKVIEFDVSYQTYNANTYAVTLIKQAMPNFVVEDLNGNKNSFSGYLVPPSPFH